MIYTAIAVPIKGPVMLNNYSQIQAEPYMFDRPDRFLVYRHREKPHSLMKDDQNQWYMTIQWKLDNLTDAKYARQVHRPAYIEESVSLNLIDYLKKEGFYPHLPDFDKAFIHTTVFVENLDELSLSRQLRLANADGEDDPSVIKNLHFIENVYNGQRTRFLAGFETRSIATVTENRYYLENIHLPASAFLYLQYFVYFQQYAFIPSKQMMARLLGNLWSSTQALNSEWNKSLLTIESIKKPH